MGLLGLALALRPFDLMYDFFDDTQFWQEAGAR
jgi:hypothetical protein